MDKNTLIPNTFQHPNAYVDWLSYYLTAEEEKVLNKAVREIIGWHNTIASRRARISLSVFVNGKVRDGKQLCMGCGLSLDTVRKALAALDEFNILVKIGKPTNDGQMYELVEVWDDLKWDDIKDRRNSWDEQNKKRTEAARATVAKGGTVGQEPGVLSDSNKETQIETQENIAPPLKKRPFSPIVEDSYLIEIYHKDKSYVTCLGKVASGPWSVTCEHCKSEVTISELDVPIECLCGMHRYILLSKKPGVRKQMHPAVLVLRKKIGNRKLNQEQVDLVESMVGTSEDDLNFWREVIEAWMQHGWYEKNVKGMLDWYGRRELPTTGKRREQGGGETTHTVIEHPPVQIPKVSDEELNEDMERWARELEMDLKGGM